MYKHDNKKSDNSQELIDKTLKKLMLKKVNNKKIIDWLLREKEFIKADNISNCATHVGITIHNNVAHIVKSNFCRERLCCVCAWRRQARFLAQMKPVLAYLEQTGYKFIFAKNAHKNTTGYGMTAKEKAEDINEMFADKEVKLIFCVSGGFNSNSTFEYLDYDLIKNNPKPLCGFSDSTSIENIIYAKTGVITFNGATFKALTSWATSYAYEEFVKRFMKADMTLGQADDEYKTIQEGTAQ